MRVAFIGDAFVDILTSPIPHLPQWEHDVNCDSVSVMPGGSVVNSARHFGALSDEKPLLAVTLGQDTLGKMMMATIREEGNVAMDHVQSVKIPMSTCLVLVGPSGKRAFVSTREGTSNDHTTAATIRESGIFEQITHDTDGRPAHVHVSGFFSTPGLQTEAFLELLREFKGRREGNTISLDTQFDASGKWRGSDDTVLRLIQLADVFFPNHLELEGIVGAYSGGDQGVVNPEKWLASECPDTLLVVKAGEDGAKVTKQGHPTVHVECPTLGEGECIDSCGAGDCFAAAFLYKFLSQSERDFVPSCAEAAARAAVRAGTWCCTQPGACSALVNLAILD
eukprot:g2924.t1